MRLLFTLISLAAGTYGYFWLVDKNPDVKERVEELIDFRTTTALETRFDSAQVMETHNKKLLKEKGARFLEPSLRYFPHLLLEVKYCDSKRRTKEGYILWDLTDGEMVLNTKSWDKTHGFADCILTSANSGELKLLHLIADQGGSCEVSALSKKCEVELPVLEILLKSCIKKNLIASMGENKYRLHLENPNLVVNPETKLHEHLTTCSLRRVERAQKNFSRSQVERLIKLAFGEGFSVRTATEIYLPVHRIVIQKADGSIRTAHYNALTGKELPPSSFYR
jgi:hypothetical protein